MHKTSLLIVSLALVIFATSCGDNNKPNVVDFDLKPVLTQLSDQHILPAYTNLSLRTGELSTSLSDFIANPGATELEELRGQIDATYLAWQEAALFDFGPALDNGLLPAFNIFPSDAAKISANIVAGSWNLGTADQIDAQGLPALDYLFFGKTDGEIIADFSTGANASNYQQYGLDLVAKLETSTNAVLDEWNDAYASTFVNSTGTDAGSAIAQFINAFNRYFERDFRDGKLGIPAGVRSLGIIQPEKTEAYFSAQSLSYLTAGLDAFQAAFNGGDGQGIDDWLDALDAQHQSGLLSGEINSRFEEARSAIVGLSGLGLSLSKVIETDTESILGTYETLQSLVVPLKIDLPSATGILITYNDNDGD